MTKELSKQYKQIFDSLVSGNEVEFTIFNQKMLNRVRSALRVIKDNWDNSVSIFGMGKDVSKLDISIKRKDPSNQYLYVISLVEKEETNFVIVDIKQGIKSTTQEES